MPIYEYQCTACGHQLEAIQKMSDEPLTECPECHKTTLTKLVSAAGFQLKGTGWYKTDYSAKGKPRSEESSGGSSSATGGTEKKTTDAKSSDTSSSGSSTSGTSSTNTGSAS